MLTAFWVILIVCCLVVAALFAWESLKWGVDLVDVASGLLMSAMSVAVATVCWYVVVRLNG